MRTSRVCQPPVAALLLFACLAPSSLAQDSQTQSIAWDPLVESIEGMAAPMIENLITVGMVIGIVRDDETRILAFGETELGSGQQPDAESIYEIGSVSKVFTGILLADAAVRGLLNLEDTVEDVFDGAHPFPRFEDQPILVWHLSTHASGLPRMPSNFRPADPGNPYADYTTEQMFEAIGKYKLRRAPGTKYAYSNLGVGLLGNLVAYVQNKPTSYERLLRNRITGPLKLQHTAIQLSPWMTEHLVPGYDVDRNPIPNWDLPAFAGAGAIRSNMTDMLRFARACLHPEDDPLREAIKLSMEVHFRDPGGITMGLGWHNGSGGRTYSHSGQTGGYYTYLALWPAGDVAVVALSNTTSGWVGQCADNALLILMGAEPRELKYKRPLPLDPVAAEPFVGDYKLGILSKLTISLVGGRMYAQKSFQPAFRIYPSGPDRFFSRQVEAEFVFKRDESGSVVQVEIAQLGQTTVGRR